MTQDARKLRRKKPQDLMACHELIDELFDFIDDVCARYERVTERCNMLLLTQYGPRRERFVEDPDQQKLFDAAAQDPAPPDDGTAATEQDQEPEQEQQEQPEDSPPPQPKRRGRRRLPAHFKRVRIEHTLDEEDLPCPCCGKPRKIVSYKISERLNYVPGYYEVFEDVRFTYACDDDTCEKHLTTAAKPPQVIEKGVAAPGLLADITVSKFTDHLPTYRKEEISDRHGWMIPRNTQCGWLRQTAATATFLVAFMMACILRSRKIHTDDTEVKVLVPGEDHAKRGRFWTYVSEDPHPCVAYDFTMNRTRDGPQAFLVGYEGYLQADAYSGYDGISFKSNGRLLLVSCGAHLRRRFYAQRDVAPEVALPALARFRALYKLERKWKDLSEQRRYELRQEQAVPLLADFHDWLEDASQLVLPKSKIGEAVFYASNQWENWQRYCDAGFLSIDNNISERMVKPLAMGRKAWLFLGSENGGATAAILYSLTASAKANRAHPFFYVRDLLETLPSIVHDSQVLPHLEAACAEAPLNPEQAARLGDCSRPTEYLDILRCHPRALADRFLRGEIEQEVVDALTALLPANWLAANERYRLEINRPTGIPVGMERILTD